MLVVAMLLTLAVNAQSVVDTAKVKLQEEQRISSILLELENRRNEAVIMTAENAKYKEVVDSLNRELTKTLKLADEYQAASDSRQKQIDLKDRIIATYTAALAAADAEIVRLRKRSGLFKKLAVAALGVGLVVGFVVGSRQ